MTPREAWPGGGSFTGHHGIIAENLSKTHLCIPVSAVVQQHLQQEPQVLRGQELQPGLQTELAGGGQQQEQLVVAEGLGG